MMDLTKSNKIKTLLKKNEISELRLAYGLGVSRSTVNSKLQLPLSKSLYQKMITAIKVINKERAMK